MDRFGINLFRGGGGPRLKSSDARRRALLPFPILRDPTKGFLNTRSRYLRISAGSPRRLSKYRCLSSSMPPEGWGYGNGGASRKGAGEGEGGSA